MMQKSEEQREQNQRETGQMEKAGRTRRQSGQEPELLRKRNSYLE
jgi:hypothetical protein